MPAVFAAYEADATPAERGKHLGIPPGLHAKIYDDPDGRGTTLSPEGARALGWVYGCQVGPECNGKWCVPGQPFYQKDAEGCEMLRQLSHHERKQRGHGPLTEETESLVRVPLLGDQRIWRLEAGGRHGHENVLAFMCEETELAWWPADPEVGPSSLAISSSPMSLLAADLANKTMLVIGDSVMEQVCGALLCSLLRDRSLHTHRSPETDTWWRLERPPMGWQEFEPFVFFSRTTGFKLACYRLNAYDDEKFASRARYDHILNLTKADILVANHGLHHGIEGYEERLRMLYGQLRALGFQAAGSSHPGPQFLWFESIAQHFQTATGDYDPSTQKQASCRCARHEAGGRNTVSFMQSEIAGRLLPEFGFGEALPFYRMTEPRFEWHPAQCVENNIRINATDYPECRLQTGMGAACDCTHPSYSPAWFDHLVSEMRTKLGFASASAPRSLDDQSHAPAAKR